MSHFNHLISELCPSGVPFKPLGELVQIRDGERRPISKDVRIAGSTPYFGANGIQGYVDGYLFDGTFLLVGEDGSVITEHNSPVMHWVTGQIWVNNHAHVLAEKSDQADLRYLYFALSSIDISALVRGVPPKLNQENLKAIKVPVAPRPVQKEIVRILDTFTDLVAELESEHEARKKQFKHYRGVLLDLDSAPELPLADICTRISSGGTPSRSRHDFFEGTIPWLRTQEVNFDEIWTTELCISEDAMASSSAKWVPKNTVVVAMYGATAAKVAIAKIPMTTNQACANLEIDPQIANYRYVFHYLMNSYENLRSLGQGTQSNLNLQQIKYYPIKLPPIETQNQIAEHLDTLFELSNSKSVGIPAELTARRKQYEHYRDTLLTFEEAL